MGWLPWFKLLYRKEYLRVRRGLETFATASKSATRSGELVAIQAHTLTASCAEFAG
jgi:hypothetical protein